MHPLLLPSSYIFEDSNIIDCIHQTCIDLTVNDDNDEIQDFLKESLEYITKDQQNDLLNELFTAILSCFSNHPNQSLPILINYLNNVKNHANCIIITANILSILTHNKDQLSIPDYSFFINDALKEILTQIKNERKGESIQLFGHEISPQFKNDLIFDLLLSSNLTDELVYDFFPYILSNYLFLENPKFDLLIQHLFNSNSNKILEQTEESNNQLIDFISTENFDLIAKMGHESFSLVKSVILYAKNDVNDKIEGLSKETILQFISVLVIYLKKLNNDKISFNFKLSDIFNDGVNFLNNEQNPILIVFNDFLLKNYNDLHHYQIISSEILVQNLISQINLLKNGKFTANKMNILHLFLTILSNNEEKSNFFSDGPQSNKLIEIFIQNLSEFQNCEELNFDVKIPSNFIKNLIETDENGQYVVQILDFIEKFNCKEKVDSTDKISIIFQMAIADKIEENEINSTEDYEDILKILKFMKENNFKNELERLKSNDELFTNAKEIFIDNDPIEGDNIEEIIKNITSDPNIEKDVNLFEALFNKMIEDEELFEIYIVHVIRRYGNYPFDVNVFMRLYNIEFEKYSDKFMTFVNKVYYFNKKERTLLRNWDYNSKSYPNSQLGTTIINNLFKEIENKFGTNFQIILCLQSIAASFPILFINFDDQLFNLASNSFKYFSLIFNEDNKNDNSILIKTCLSSFSLLLVSFQSPVLIDKFNDWFFTNISTFDNYQIYGFMNIINTIIHEYKIGLTFIPYIIKYNVFELLSNLIEKITNEETNKDLLEYLRKAIFTFISEVYRYMNQFTNYESIQIDEFMKLEYPINRIFDQIFGTYSWVFLLNEIKMNEIPKKYLQFLKDSLNPREFWIFYNYDKKRPNDATFKQIKNFISKLDVKSDQSSFDIPKIPDSFTIKMSRYLVKKPVWLYSWFLFSKPVPLIPLYYEQLLSTIEDLYSLLNDAYDDPDGEDNCNSSSLTTLDYLFPLYCQQSLFKNLINQIKFMKSSDDSCFKALCEACKNIGSKSVSLLSLLDIFNQYLTQTGNNCSSHEMRMICEILITISTLEGFKENFIDLCGEKLLDFVLAPKYRSDKVILSKVTKLFVNIETKIPNRSTHLVAFSFILNGVENESAIKLCSKFDINQLACINEIILNLFDQKANKSDISSAILLFLENIPSLLQERRSKFVTILSNYLDSYYSNNSDSENNESFKLITNLFNALAPKRGNSTSLSMVIEKSTIPNEIKETFPIFWDMFEKYSPMIFESIEKNPDLLDDFKFLHQYPELLSFKIRSSYFRKKMKKRIKKDHRVDLKVDRNNLLTTSFRSFRGKSKEDLLRKFRVDFKGEREIDLDGPTREWFTELSKEIFNQNYGLFDCSHNKKSYKPSNLSSINPNHLEYFKFAGQFIARALIQGQCIDAHFTTSFCKQILHRELDLNDLEDADEELYRNLDWMLHNDVDSLEMYFEIDVIELGIIKTIPLKENGEKIRVTNDNKKEYIFLRINYLLKKIIEEQINSFCEGFDSLISHNDIKMFTPNELDLLICGIPKIDVNDFINNITFEHPYNAETPVVKMFFNVISKWDSEKLAKLLLFMTGSSRVPSNGFKEFCEMCNRRLTISPGGDSSKLPQSHTCFNTLCLPRYESEEELNKKILFAIQECSTFEMA